MIISPEITREDNQELKRDVTSAPPRTCFKLLTIRRRKDPPQTLKPDRRQSRSTSSNSDCQTAGGKTLEKYENRYGFRMLFAISVPAAMFISEFIIKHDYRPV
jgi:hypothetical protein